MCVLEVIKFQKNNIFLNHNSDKINLTHVSRVHYRNTGLRVHYFYKIFSPSFQTGAKNNLKKSVITKPVCMPVNLTANINTGHIR